MFNKKIFYLKFLFSILYGLIGIYSFYLNYKFGFIWAGGVLEGFLFAFILFVGMAGTTYVAFSINFSTLTRVITGTFAILLISISIWTTFLLKAHDSYALYSEKNITIQGFENKTENKLFNEQIIKEQIQAKLNTIKNKQESINNYQKEENLRFSQYEKEIKNFEASEVIEKPQYKPKYSWTIKQLNNEIGILNKEISELQNMLIKEEENKEEENITQKDFHIISTFSKQFNFLSPDNLMNLMNFIFSALGDVLNIFLLFVFTKLNNNKKYKESKPILLKSLILKKTKKRKKKKTNNKNNKKNTNIKEKINVLKLKKFIHYNGCLTPEEFYNLYKDTGLGISAQTMKDLLNKKRNIGAGLHSKTVEKLKELNKESMKKFNFSFIEKK